MVFMRQQKIFIKYLILDNVSGGTGWAIAYAAEKIDGIERLIYVYNQKDSKWYKYNYNTNVFELYNDTPVLTNKYAGIGTRKIEANGKQAIKDVYEKTFKSQQPETQTKITIKDRIDILENELKELENLKKDILIGTPEVLIAINLPKITPDSATKETGGKIGVNKDINPNLISKDGVSVERAAEDINNDYPDMDIQTIRNYIIDILQTGVVNFVNSYTNQNRIDSIKNEIAELKRNKSGQLNLFDDFDADTPFSNSKECKKPNK